MLLASQDVFTMAFLQFQHLINKGMTIFLQLFSLIFNCPKLVPPFQSLWKHRHMGMDEVVGNNEKRTISGLVYLKHRERNFILSSQV